MQSPDSGLAAETAFAAPLLRAQLGWIPWAAQWRRIAEIEIAEIFHRHSMKKPSSEYVDALGHLGAPVSDDLCSQQLSGVCVAGDSNSQLVCTRVVGFVVPSDGLDRKRIEPCCFGLMSRSPVRAAASLKTLTT